MKTTYLKQAHKIIKVLIQLQPGGDHESLHQKRDIEKVEEDVERMDKDVNILKNNLNIMD